MRTRVQKWGNSLAVRIPKAFAAEVGLADGTSAEVTLKGRKLIVEAAAKPILRLEDLLKGVTRRNRHAEVDAGPAMGVES